MDVQSLMLLSTSWVLVGLGHGACGVLRHSWSPHVQGLPRRAAPQVIPACVVTRLVLHLDRDDAVGITRIPLLDPWSFLLEARDRDGGQGTRLVQAGHKRKIDLVPRGEITRRRAGVVELAAFEIAKMP